MKLMLFSPKLYITRLYKSVGILRWMNNEVYGNKLYINWTCYKFEKN